MNIVDAGYFLGNNYDRIKFWSNDYFLDHQVLRLTVSSLQNEFDQTFLIKGSGRLSDAKVKGIEQWVKKKAR